MGYEKKNALMVGSLKCRVLMVGSVVLMGGSENADEKLRTFGRLRCFFALMVG